MATDATGNERTLVSYASDLLKYPRFIIERDVDFTNCRHGGRHNEFLSECAECQFGVACFWLDQHRSPSIDDATLDELFEAIESACQYMQVKTRKMGVSDAETRDWIREARRFLNSRRQ